MTTTTAAPPQTLTFTRTIQAPAAQVYRSFTNRDDICDWLCPDADVRAEEGGYLFLMWRDGNHAYGKISKLKENEKLVLNWHGSHGDGISRVKVVLEEKDDRTALTLVHDNIADEAVAEQYQKDWDRSLDNLKSILETGANLSITERVIMGIYAGPFNEEIAKSLGVPATQGVRVAGLVPGFSAEAAGLQVDDVVVEAAGKPLGDGYTIFNATEDKKPGDSLDVAYYRGKEKHSVTVTLKGYPIPPIPADFKGLADTLEKTFADLDKKLTNTLKDVPEEVADQTHVSTYDGNVRETLANLILGQRATREWLVSYTYPEGPRRTSMRVSPTKVKAVLAVHPTLPDLLAELRRNWTEIVTIARELPEELLARKNYLWWITFEIDPAQVVLNTTIDQLKATLAAAG
jgi:uncharacterized protein YndB with AHSA1/START domain